jgi:hypothetical protein
VQIGCAASSSHHGGATAITAVTVTGSPPHWVLCLSVCLSVCAFQDPHKFWQRQRAYAFPGLSWNSIVTKFTVMVTDPAVIRHCFNHNR